MSQSNRRAVEIGVRVVLRVPALRHRQSRHLLTVLVVPFEPARIGDRHALPRPAEPVRRGELRRPGGVLARQVLIGAARVVHRPPHHRVVADAGQQRVDRLLHRAADIHRADLDVPGQVRQFQHRHHAVDRDDRDPVDLGMPRGRQFRVGRQPVDIGQLQSGIGDRVLDRGQRMHRQRRLGGARHFRKPDAADRHLAPVLPHARSSPAS
jgi:hypothetical protein